MALSEAEIGAVLDEIRPVVVGGWIQKVFQPTETGIALEIRSPGRTVLLNISALPETARIHLQSRRTPNPDRPPTFCQLLRARLQGGRIESLEQAARDRIVEIEVHTKESMCFLVAELTGRGANVLLLDRNRTILATLRPDKARMKTAFGQPRREHTPTAHADLQRFIRAGEDEFPISRAIESHYGERDHEAIHAAAQHQRLLALRKQMKKLTRRADGLEQDLEKARRYEPYARYGELLKANLAQLKKGQAEATVVDYFEAQLPTLSLPLDPAKSPQANMEDYFHKHRKFLTAQREIAPRLLATRQELITASEELQRIERGDWSPPAASQARPRRQGTPSRAAEVKPRKGPFRRFQSHDGYPIYVGRNANENEELTHRFANSEDLWLHARGVPGSHVVVRLPKGTDPPVETLRDAATLALQYSDLKKSGKGEVIYTRKKWVKKAKGQAAGTVTVTQDKSIHVQLDRARLDRLKTTAG